jgi:transposase
MKPNSQMTVGEFFRQCVGIDISKKKFTVCLYMYDRASDAGCCTQSVDFANTKTGFNQMVKWSRKEAVKGQPLTYLMEPTGSYYEKLAYHLNKIGLTVYVVLPNKARQWCEAEGVKTKTDAMDARCLALMGCASRKLSPWSPPAAIYRELRQITRFHADLCKVRTSVANRMEALDNMYGPDKSVRKHCEKLLEEIDNLMEKNDEALLCKLAEDKDLKSKVERIAGAKGVSIQTVACVIAETDGFHLIRNRKQLTSYAGFDVVAKQSGGQDPKHKISKKGNANIRAALYMPALVATRYNKQMKAAYDRICQKHPNEKKIGVTAVMRRILLLIYTLWKNGEEYDENKDKANAKGKKKQAQEHGPEDCLAVNEEHVEGGAEDENGQPSS